MPRLKQAQWVCQRIQADFLDEVMEVPRLRKGSAWLKVQSGRAGDGG